MSQLWTTATFTSARPPSKRYHKATSRFIFTSGWSVTSISMYWMLIIRMTIIWGSRNSKLRTWTSMISSRISSPIIPRIDILKRIYWLMILFIHLYCHSYILIFAQTQFKWIVNLSLPLFWANSTIYIQKNCLWRKILTFVDFFPKPFL